MPYLLWFSQNKAPQFDDNYHITVVPRYTVPRYTVFLDIPCTIFFPQIACLAVFTRKTYLDIPCTSIYRAFFVSPKKHGISRNYCTIFNIIQRLIQVWVIAISFTPIVVQFVIFCQKSSPLKKVRELAPLKKVRHSSSKFGKHLKNVF